MRRFQGEPLPEHSRIAIVANDALGNYVVSTPLIQMLRSKYPGADLDYYGGTRTEELWSNEPMIDHGYAIFGRPPYELASHLITSGTYNLVVNLESSEWAKAFTSIASGHDGFVVGPSVGPQGRGDLPFAQDERGRLAADAEWTAADLTSRYPFLHSGFIGEIFSRLAYLDGPVPGYRVPSKTPEFEVPEVLIATSASLPEKLWPLEGWRRALTFLRDNRFTVGLLGAKPSAQRHFWQGEEAEQRMVDEGLAQDLRGRLSLSEVVGALAKAKLVLTLDNGILHLAAATSTPTIGLFREGIHRLWAPPVSNLKVITPPSGGQVAEIAPETVLEALESAR
ncbi:glycosyltransferase family 9 protein [Fimbriimonas ginsengisoli]|uniref:Heptosyltransferase family protein n=1 Tax=Fimbriimonas ginsengisoli Gsoil 348 TaxID=661478 RepID=A0A068NZ79_FIMGI|nr:glycosyltransferase family 9 protein [Fimbriimonas ginsengisoli]AIE88104.1 heptosyltransferase family protein [Fimbriimonas ginsengisoli Gsoil 348]